MGSNENVRERLRDRWKKMIMGVVVAFTVGFWLLSRVFGLSSSRAAGQTFLYAGGGLLAYYAIITRGRFQKVY